MSDKQIPVLVGVGQVTEREFDRDSASPMDLMEQASLLAAEDAGIKASWLSELDVLAVVKSFREPTPNSAETLANRLGATRATQWMLPDGGNGPQYLVNRYAEAIANGDIRFALFSGAEAMATGRKYFKETGEQPPWSEPASREPQYLVDDVPMSTPHENDYGLRVPPQFYALCENALRGHYGETVEEHQIAMGRLFSRFTEAAATSPHAWYPIRRSAEDIAWPSESNRYVGWPYTKYMNAMNQINQSATLLLTSVEYARQLGVSEDRFIFLHGCADTKEKRISLRPNYYSSQAIQVMAERVFEGSGLTMNDIDYIDFYSCFPSAVQIARDTFGMERDDPRPLTITGGLPFHGGAGNNYVMNSIAAMVEKLRADPGKYGLVTANGGYFSKHAAGIYSTVPTEGDWTRVDPTVYQQEIDEAPDAPFTESPAGEATIETYTVGFGRDNNPQQGIVIGRLGEFGDPAAKRFLSMLPDDPALLRTMTEAEHVGAKGRVQQVDGINVFTPG